MYLLIFAHGGIAAGLIESCSAVTQFFVQTDFDVTLNLEITSKDTNNVTTVFQKNLTVNYKKTGGEKYNK